jgi:2-octaprenyl-6-methoxyphenol hydroxylase
MAEAAAERCDVAIIGGGPVGACLALALAGTPVSVALFERGTPAAAQPASPPALRAIALSYSSRLILERIGAWHDLAHTPIRQVHVSQSGRFGRTLIGPEDTGTPELGYVLEYAPLAARLLEDVRQRAIRVIAPAEVRSVRAGPDHARLRYSRGGEEAVLEARLVVHAEGSPDEDYLGRDYAQHALVALVECAPEALGTAYERFTAEGPLALLPLAGRYAVVWGCSVRTADALAGADAGAFLAALQSAAGRRAGRFTALRSLGRAPLALRYRASRIAQRAAYIGNAAQTLHPVAGQGLNLGLRDAWDLARSIRAQPAASGSAPMLERYARARRFDAAATLRVTDLLATLYVSGNPLVCAARSGAMAALDMFPPARRFFARRMTYGASALP